jgi:hypothetical protein
MSVSQPESRPEPQPEPRSGSRPESLDVPDFPDSYDDLLATLLIRSWMVATGRTLRTDVPPAELPVEELIDFWADDFGCEPDPVFRIAGRASRPGRHAKRSRECRDGA